MTIKRLANNYGTFDLLAAYIMRTIGVDEEKAKDMAYVVDMDLERMLEEMIDNEEEVW